MSESLTDGEQPIVPASDEPTGDDAIQTPAADNSNQETISGEQSQEAVSDDGSAQNKNNENNGTAVTDDGLAKFAKSQGVEDYETLSNNEKKFLKMAHDNQKAYRQASQPKIADTAKELNKPADDASDNDKVLSEIKQFRYEQKSAAFWGEDGRNRELEGTMVQILNEQKEKHGAAYASTLSQDLPTLYDLARLRSGEIDPNTAIEQGRQLERDFIRNKSSAGAPPAHASTSAPSTNKINMDWVNNTYDASNPEHRKALDEALARGDLY